MLTAGAIAVSGNNPRSPAIQELHHAADVFRATRAAQGAQIDDQASQPGQSDPIDRMAAELVRETEEVLLADALGADSNRTSLVPPTGFEPALPP